MCHWSVWGSAMWRALGGYCIISSFGGRPLVLKIGMVAGSSNGRNRWRHCRRTRTVSLRACVVAGAVVASRSATSPGTEHKPWRPWHRTSRTCRSHPHGRRASAGLQAASALLEPKSVQATAQDLRVNISPGSLHSVNAGHPYPTIHRAATGEVARLDGAPRALLGVAVDPEPARRRARPATPSCSRPMV